MKNRQEYLDKQREEAQKTVPREELVLKMQELLEAYQKIMIEMEKNPPNYVIHFTKQQIINLLGEEEGNKLWDEMIQTEEWQQMKNDINNYGNQDG